MRLKISSQKVYWGYCSGRRAGPEDECPGGVRLGRFYRGHESFLRHIDILALLNPDYQSITQTVSAGTCTQ